MKMECKIEVPPNATEITIGWFLNCRQLMNDSSVSIWTREQIVSEVRRVRSRLTISDLTDDYVGDYTCNMLGDVEYVPSNHLTVQDADYLEVEAALGSCPDNGLIINPVTEDRCALITHDNPIPLSLVCETPPATSLSKIHPTTSLTILNTSIHLPSSSTSPSLIPTHTPTPDVTAAMPSPGDNMVDSTASTGQDLTSTSKLKQYRDGVINIGHLIGMVCDADLRANLCTTLMHDNTSSALPPYGAFIIIYISNLCKSLVAM